MGIPFTRCGVFINNRVVVPVHEPQEWFIAKKSELHKNKNYASDKVHINNTKKSIIIVGFTNDYYICYN